MSGEPKPGYVPADKLAEVCHLTDRRLRQLAKEGWFPEPKNGQYKFTETLQGLFKFYQSGAVDDRKAAAGHKTRKLKAEADRVELENEKTRGSLVEAEAVYKHYEKFFVALRQAILGSSLTEEEKDELLNNLRGIKARDLRGDSLKVDS